MEDAPTEDTSGDGGGSLPGDGASGDHVVARGRVRLVVARVATVGAFLLVLAGLVGPDQFSHLTPQAFLRIPAEGILGVALLLVLPQKAGRVVAAVGGALLGLVTVVKITDIGFDAALGRPFNLVFDWSFLGPAVDLVRGLAGLIGAIAAVVGVAVVIVAVVVLMTRSTLRLTHLVAARRIAAVRTTAVLAVAWMVCAFFGAEIAPGVPIAAASAASLTYNDVRQVKTDLGDHDVFDQQVATDAFRDTPDSQLLTGLRGKNVVFVFVESYGRVAVQDSDIAPQVDALLDDGTKQLNAAGFDSRSAFLTSPTFGGGSYLAHSTLESGVWIDNQQRYSNLVATDRLTLARAFQRAGWKTVGDVPSNTQPWAEEPFYGFNQYYDAHNVGYRGPSFSYANMPDQYTMSVFQRSELSAPDHPPVMAEIDLVSSHWPWAPLPQMVDWNKVGDGSVYDPMPAQGDSVKEVWSDPARVHAAYGQSIQYALNTLISYVKTYADNNTVLIFLGDHQPNQSVSGDTPNRDVPISIVARDPAVLNGISGWGWQEGLRPDAQAPVWPMSAFRDRFLTAFGPSSVGKTALAGPASPPRPH